MKRYFTKAFSRFFFGFLVIILIAFGIMIWAGYQEKAQQQNQFDNFAAPQ